MLVSHTIHTHTSTATIVRIATGNAAVADIALFWGLATYYG